MIAALIQDPIDDTVRTAIGTCLTASTERHAPNARKHTTMAESAQVDLIELLRIVSGSSSDAELRKTAAVQVDLFLLLSQFQ